MEHLIPHTRGGGGGGGAGGGVYVRGGIACQELTDAPCTVAASLRTAAPYAAAAAAATAPVVEVAGGLGAAAAAVWARVAG